MVIPSVLFLDLCTKHFLHLPPLQHEKRDERCALGECVSKNTVLGKNSKLGRADRRMWTERKNSNPQLKVTITRLQEVTPTLRSQAVLRREHICVHRSEMHHLLCSGTKAQFTPHKWCVPYSFSCGQEGHQGYTSKVSPHGPTETFTV